MRVSLRLHSLQVGLAFRLCIVHWPKMLSPSYGNPSLSSLKLISLQAELSMFWVVYLVVVKKRWIFLGAEMRPGNWICRIFVRPEKVHVAIYYILRPQDSCKRSCLLLEYVLCTYADPVGTRITPNAVSYNAAISTCEKAAKWQEL